MLRHAFAHSRIGPEKHRRIHYSPAHIDHGLDQRLG